jgi:AraC-like DNA-binding protein
MHFDAVHITRATHPYDCVRAMPSFRAWTPEHGEVALVQLRDSTSWSAHTIRAITTAMRRDFPVAIGLVLPADSERAIRIATHAHWMGCRAVVRDTSRLAADLRSCLAYPVDLVEEIVESLQMQHGVNDTDASFMRQLCRACAQARTIADVARIMGCLARTTRARLNRMNLPNPERWFQLIRLLRIQLDLMQDPSLSLAHVARREGFTGSQGLDNATRRAFGVSVHRARQLLGLEWRLAAWMLRKAESTRDGTILPPRELPQTRSPATVR